MSYTKQTWDTTSYVNPTRMNHIENGIDNALPKDTGGIVQGDITIDKQDGTSSAIGQSRLYVGNNIPSGTAGNSKGILSIYSTGASKANIESTNLTADRNFELPNKSGTILVDQDFSYTEITGFTPGTNVSNVSVATIKVGNLRIIKGAFKIPSGSVSAGGTVIYGLGFVGQAVCMYASPYLDGGVATYLNGTIIAGKNMPSANTNSYSFVIILTAQ